MEGPRHSPGLCCLPCATFLSLTWYVPPSCHTLIDSCKPPLRHPGLIKTCLPACLSALPPSLCNLMHFLCTFPYT